ncbi:hypothetical protein HBN50_15855 [Halobacteriovorax sp. GB3]|uniref:hypothetical protein n=1 Tax=Halobacteriovorax sp. GB3 TaxID=2719615 RepID=UPI002361F4C2|nr:hypothetical protein [Halobacteriovorax sp. GB3]MDD0854587.1 hypothetical protein [Halobacteriovorax sp. GB3]
MLHVEINGVEKTQVNNKAQETLELQSVPKFLSFLHMHKSLEYSSLPELADEELRLIKKYIEANDFLEVYELAYAQAQEECFFVDSSLEKKCEALLDIYFAVNELLHSGEEYEVDAEEKKLGIVLDGASITEEIAVKNDPNYKLMIESQSTENRYMSTVIKDNNLKERADFYICEFKKEASISVDVPYMKELTDGLESVLVSEETALNKKKEIFCLLWDFYQRTENYDRLINFLYLNVPEGENFCRENIEP